ncbi:MAG: hypothetical protein JWR44_784 [Hymenobacter sp.]|jgi:hypothetical protein|nr:hypothetical protein [Hymenobacter sp.]
MEFPLLYYNSRLHALGLLVMFIPGLGIAFFLGWFIFFSLFMTDTPANWPVRIIIGFFGLVVASAGMLVTILIKRLFSASPRLMLTSTGITDNTIRVGEIAWQDIEDAQLYYASKAGTTISLKVRNANEYLKRLSGIHRIARFNWLSGSRILLNLTGTDAITSAVLATIKSQITAG